LSSSRELIVKGTIESESQQCVQAAYRQATGKPLLRLELFSKLSEHYPDAAGDRLLILCTQRSEGRPLQHLVGYQAFLDHDYEVGPDVLIPRPETEVLVRLIQESLAKKSSSELLGIEIGVGSGAISIELLASLGSLKMWASDIQGEALLRARRNAERILGPEVSRFTLIQAASPGEVLEPFSHLVPQSLDFIVSNPPYLGHSDEIEDEVRYHEPRVALFAPEEDLLYFYRKIAEGAARFLKPKGQVFLELAHERAGSIQSLFASGLWSEVQVHQDLARRPRVLVATLA
jgi:release factor glutamine methyltransferase